MAAIRWFRLSFVTTSHNKCIGSKLAISGTLFIDLMTKSVAMASIKVDVARPTASYLIQDLVN